MSARLIVLARLASKQRMIVSHAEWQGHATVLRGIADVSAVDMGPSSYLHAFRHDVRIEVTAVFCCTTTMSAAAAAALGPGGVQLRLPLRQLLVQVLRALRQPRVAILRRQLCGSCTLGQRRLKHGTVTLSTNGQTSSSTSPTALSRYHGALHLCDSSGGSGPLQSASCMRAKLMVASARHLKQRIHAVRRRGELRCLSLIRRPALECGLCLRLQLAVRVCALGGPCKMAPSLQAAQVCSPGRVLLQVHLQMPIISTFPRGLSFPVSTQVLWTRLKSSKFQAAKKVLHDVS